MSSGNPLQDRLKYVKSKFEAAKSVGVTSSSGAVTGMGSQPIPLVRRASILLTPYSVGKSGSSITGDAIPFYSSDSNFAMGNSNGIMAAIVNRLGAFGLRNYPIYKEEPAKTSTPANSSTSGYVNFYGSVQPQTASQKLNKLLS